MKSQGLFLLIADTRLEKNIALLKKIYYKNIFILKLDIRRADEPLIDRNQKKSVNMLRQNCIEDLLKLIDRLDHIGERIKTEDVHQRQMELALKIHRLVSQKRTEYMKVRNF